MIDKATPFVTLMHGLIADSYHILFDKPEPGQEDKAVITITKNQAEELSKFLGIEIHNY